MHDIPVTATRCLLFRHRVQIQSWRGLQQVSPILSTDAPTDFVDQMRLIFDFGSLLRNRIDRHIPYENGLFYRRK